MAQKRISRARKRDLERPDEFITFGSRMLNAFRTHWKTVSFGIGVVVVLVVGVLVYGYFGQKAEDRAILLLNQAMDRYTAELSRQGPEPALEAVAADFKTLLADYGDRQTGAVARVLYAQINYRAGRWEAAEAAYEDALRRFPENAYGAAAAWNGLGYTRAAAGENEKAITAFTKVVSGPDPVLKADALYQLALLYRQTGREDEYRATVETLKKDYPDFMYAEVLPSFANGG